MPTLRWLATAALIAPCSGCFAPFPHDRHDLVDFRILGVQVDDAAPEPGQVVTARALVYGGEGFYHDELPSLSWSLGEASAVGPVVDLEVPSEPGTWDLTLVATHADGVQQEQAVLPLVVGSGVGPLPPPELPPIQRGVIELPLDGEAEAFFLDARAQLETEAGYLPLEPGQAARLRLPLDDPDGRWHARWMTAGAQGSFLELDALVTDWLPATVFLDEEDGVVEVSEELPVGLYGLAVLVVDDAGSNAWAFVDVNLGVPHSFDSAGWAEHDGRLLSDPMAPTSGLVTVKLLQDDDSPWGVALSGGSAYLPWEAGAPFELDHPPCEHPLPAREPFQLDWIAEGLCSRQAVLGQRVVMRVTFPLHTWSAP